MSTIVPFPKAKATKTSWIDVTQDRESIPPNVLLLLEAHINESPQPPSIELGYLSEKLGVFISVPEGLCVDEVADVLKVSVITTSEGEIIQLFS